MKVIIRKDLKADDMGIPSWKISKRKPQFIYAEELDGAKFIKHKVNGKILVELSTGELRNLYSIDVDYVEDSAI